MDENIQRENFWTEYAKDKRKERLASVNFGFGDQKQTVTVQPTISVSEFAAVVNGVIESCFYDDTYVSWAEEVVFRRAVIQAYTNAELPESLDEVFDILYLTDLYNQVVDKVDQEQFWSLHEAVQRGIRCRLNDRWSVIREEATRALDEVKDLSQQCLRLVEEVNKFTSTDLKSFVQSVATSNEKLNAGIRAAAIANQNR